MTRVTIEENDDVSEESQAGFYIDEDGDLWILDDYGYCVLVEVRDGKVGGIDFDPSVEHMKDHNARRFRGTITVGD